MPAMLRSRRCKFAMIASLCLLPSLVSWAASGSRQQAPSEWQTSQQSALAMHIHMVHLREFDLRDGKAVARFDFHNAASQPLKIQQIKPSCGCVTTRMYQADNGFAAGAKGKFYLEVDTAAESAGFHEYDVKIDYQVAGQAASSQQVTFRIEVPEKKVTVRPRALIFYQLGSEPTTQTVEVTDFRQGYELEIIDMKSVGDHFQVSPPQLTTNSSGVPTWSFEITADGNVPSAQQTGYVNIETNDAEFPQLRLPILIYGPPEQSASKTGTTSKTQ